MGVSELLAANVPYWRTEAELISAYFDAPARSRASDLRWIARQCHKELFDGVVPRVQELRARESAARPLVEVARELREETTHLELFAELYERFREPAAPALTDDALRRAGWAENAALGRVRARHRRRHGALGALAARLTEGGGCALFLAGMRLAGRGGVDDAIADVCARVYADERDHVGGAVSEIERHDLVAREWALLGVLTVEQSAARLHMRAAQFYVALAVAAESALADPIEFLT